MLSYFFLDLDPYTFTFLRVANVFVFDLDRIDRLGEVGMFFLNVNNTPTLSSPPVSSMMLTLRWE